uniref:chromatin assembly factor 1 subunit A-like isoform X2 n=1 Tax=Myxine glutinosa TaxID=7769 RepID=UPI00358E76AC
MVLVMATREAESVRKSTDNDAEGLNRDPDVKSMTTPKRMVQARLNFKPLDSPCRTPGMETPAKRPKLPGTETPPPAKRPKLPGTETPPPAKRRKLSGENLSETTFPKLDGNACDDLISFDGLEAKEKNASKCCISRQPLLSLTNSAEERRVSEVVIDLTEDTGSAVLASDLGANVSARLSQGKCKRSLDCFHDVVKGDPLAHEEGKSELQVGCQELAKSGKKIDIVTARNVIDRVEPVSTCVGATHGPQMDAPLPESDSETGKEVLPNVVCTPPRSGGEDEAVSRKKVTPTHTSPCEHTVSSPGDDASFNSEEGCSTPENSVQTTPASQHVAKSASSTPKRKLSASAQKKFEEKQRKREEREHALEARRQSLAEEKKLKKEQREVERRRRDEEQRERKEQEERERAEKLKQKEERKERDEQERTEKLKHKEERKKERQEALEAKNEEKRKKEEEKNKVEIEKKQKDEKHKEAFVKFFKKQSCLQNQKTLMPNCGLFAPFEIKANMALAPLCRVLKADCKQLDALLSQQSNHNKYLEELKQRPALTSTATVIEQQEDVIQEIPRMPQDIPEAPEAHGPIKLLYFHENYRPAYYGTWRKFSKQISPRNPYAKDEELLDYEVDSDDEWNEEEPGESLSNSEGEEENENEEEDDDDNDGFFVPHGHLSDEEGASDEENSPERKKVREQLKNKEWVELTKGAKLKPLVPRIVGCTWENGVHNPSASSDMQWLRQFSAVHLETMEEEDEERSKNRHLEDQQLLRELLPHLHGSPISSRDIIKNVQSEWALRTAGSIKALPSKRRLMQLIKQNATYRKHESRPPCWLVHDHVLHSLGMPDLQLMNISVHTHNNEVSSTPKITAFLQPVIDSKHESDVEMPSQTEERGMVACRKPSGRTNSSP